MDTKNLYVPGLDLTPSVKDVDSKQKLHTTTGYSSKENSKSIVKLRQENKNNRTHMEAYDFFVTQGKIQTGADLG